MRPAHGAGGGVALLEEGIEQPAAVVTQLHDRLLGHGSLLSEVSLPKNTGTRNRCNKPLVPVSNAGHILLLARLRRIAYAEGTEEHS
jgi:hypothetical protein